MQEALREKDNILNRIGIGNIVKIKYYKNRRYIEIKGLVTKIDYIKKKIQIDNESNINISDIINIETI